MAKSTIIRLSVSLTAGLLFGMGMIISNMVDPAKVIGFLDITGNWDPSLAFVMGGALAVFTPIYHLLIKKRASAINGDKFTWTSNTKIDGRLISGALIFGAGWGLAGFCPGPAIVNIAAGGHIILAFILSMIVGMILAKKYH
jgi:uncharacterized protein